SAEWEKKAELAVKNGRDDLAREALKRKADYENNATTYEAQWKSQQELVTKLKDQLTALESKYDSTMTNKDALIARHRRAEAQKQVTQTISALSVTDHTSELSRMERRIKGEEATAAALDEVQSSSLDQQFADLTEDSGVDEQLAALKSKVAGQGGQTSEEPKS
ncbi:MAG: PspA/IM30 family protein, partial [Chloroflexi bacterium]|nr:PspA/IM30 family protein [Chloroflexota bacterium]